MLEIPQHKNHIQLDPNIYAQEFFVGLSNSPDLVPYLSLDFSPHVSSNFTVVMGELVTFYNFTVLASKPQIEDQTYFLLNLYSCDSHNLHTIEYISNRIFRIKDKKYDKQIIFFNSLIEFLMPFMDKFGAQPIVIDMGKLVDDFHAENPKIKYYEAKLEKIQLQMHKKVELDPNNEKLFSKLVDSLSHLTSPKKHLKSPHIFGIHCFQHIFNEVVSSNRFTFYDEIKSLIKHHNEFKTNEFNRMIKFVGDKIVSHFEVKNPKTSEGVIFILMIRYVYDQIYPTNTYFFKPCRNIIYDLSKCNFEKLDVELEFCPPEKTKSFKTPRNVFRNDPFYWEAVYFLEEMQFMTNPMDILISVHKSIKAIEKAASHYSGSVIEFSFNESFSLFLAVALSSDIPEFINIVDFANDYVIDEDASMYLLSARATVVACVTKFTELLGIND